MSFLRRQAITAALTANAVRPVSDLPGRRDGVLPGLADHRAVAAPARGDPRGHRGPAATGSRRPQVTRAGRAQRRRARLPDLAQPAGAAPGRERAGRGARRELPRRSSTSSPRRPTSRRRGGSSSTRSGFGNNGGAGRAQHRVRARGQAQPPRRLRARRRASPTAARPCCSRSTAAPGRSARRTSRRCPLMYHLAAKGWVCVAINYRLAPRDAFPAQIIDVKKGIAWIRENIASYGGDPDYIAITGGSAGGHLCALAALTPNDPEWQPGFEDVDTSVQVAVPALRRLRLRRRDRAQAGGADARLLPRPAGRSAPVRRRPRGVRGRHPDSCGSPRTHRTSWSSTAPTTASSASTRPGCSSRSCARRRNGRSPTSSCTAPSTPSTSSRRSGPRTSCARSTGTCTGTGTSTAGKSRRTRALVRCRRDCLRDTLSGMTPFSASPRPAPPHRPRDDRRRHAPGAAPCADRGKRPTTPLPGC